MGTRNWMAACAAAMACAWSASADAGVIFSSIPDLSVTPASDWNATTPDVVAGSFTLTKPEIVTGFDFVADLQSDLAFEAYWITADDHGKPGEVLLGAGGLRSSGTLGSTITASDTRLFTVLVPNSPITLGPGTYWFGVTSPQTGIEGFAGGDGSMVQCGAFPNGCTPTGQTMGFDVLAPGSAVPEPTTWAVVILGLFMLGTTLRRAPRYAVTTQG